MSDEFDEILASLNAGENPTASTNGEVTILSMRSQSSGKKETKFGTQTIMEYVLNPDGIAKKDITPNDIAPNDIDPETSDK